MSLLLDSNVLLWWLVADPRLNDAVLAEIEAATPLAVSLVTPWELWIKTAGGKLRLPADFEQRLRDDAFTILAPTLADPRLAASLPPIHRDPFDRMIIAQALNHQATVITGDRHFGAYGVDVILV